MLKYSLITLLIILMILKTLVHIDALENGRVTLEKHLVQNFNGITKDTTKLNSDIKASETPRSQINDQNHFTLDSSASVNQAKIQDFHASKTDTIPHRSAHSFSEIQTEENFNIPEQNLPTQKVATSAVKDLTSNPTLSFAVIPIQHHSLNEKQNVSVISTTGFSDISSQVVTNIPTKDICQYGGCELASGKYWYCQCDDVCEEYNDCCLGHKFTNKSFDYSKFSCVRIGSDTFFGVQSISICPKAYTNESIIAKCSYGHIWDAGQPMLDSTNYSRVFRNKYCALCHGVSALPLEVVFTFRRLSDYNHNDDMSYKELMYYLFKTCTYRIKIPEEANIRYCLSGLVQNDDYLCSRYSNPVIYPNEKTYYRNNFCRDNQDKSYPHCVYKLMHNMILALERGNNYKLTKLSILFSFKEPTAVTGKSKCVEWNEKIEKDCEHLPKLINAQIDLDYNIRLPKNATKTEMMQAALLTFLVKSVQGFSEMSLTYQMRVDKKSTTMNIKTKCKITKTVFHHEITSIKQLINKQRITIKEKSSDRRFEIINQENNQDTWNMTGELIYKPTKKTKEQFYSYYGITISNVTFLELCNDIEVLVYRKGTETLKIVSFNCKSKLLQLKPNTLAILTVTFSSISSISLVIMIINNRRHTSHLEVPVSNLENLSISMVLSTLLLMAGHLPTNLNEWICYAISVSSHYLWLTVFSFTSLAVLHIVKNLMQLKARRFNNKETKTRRRRKMTLLGLTIPFVFVIPAIVVDQIGPLHYSPGYGTNDVCFPTRFPGNLIFFTGPILGLIAIDTMSIVQIIVKIRMVTVATENLQRSSSFSEAKIFFRVLSISGCLWITGVLAAFFESEWMEYVFTTLCGLQGLFITIANLTTKKMNFCKIRE